VRISTSLSSAKKIQFAKMTKRMNLSNQGKTSTY